MEKRKRFDDELIDLENPGADDSFLNEYLEDEETKKKLKKSSPPKTIKISFKKFAPLQSVGQEQAIQETVTEQTEQTEQEEQEEQSSMIQEEKTREKQLIEPQKEKISSSLSLMADKENETKEEKLVKDAVSLDKIQENILEIQENKALKKVVNDKRLNYVPKESRFLGHVLYTGAHKYSPGLETDENLELFLLPKFSVLEHYALLQVRIPAEFLVLKDNLAIKANAVWGTGVYTDDSDVVAALIHSGSWKHQELKPSHDLNVTLRILPRLEKYQGSSRHGISSRSWGSFHDGESFKIEKVEIAPLGSAKKLGRKKGSREWIDQSSSLKDEPILVMTLEQGWKKYSLKSLNSSTWTQKLKSYNLIFMGNDDSTKFELSWNPNDSVFKLSDQSTFKTFKALEFNDKGIVLDDEEINLSRYVWKHQNENL